MILKQVLDRKVGGYWDGGLKDTFEWELQGPIHRDAKGPFIKCGSWEANHWFMVPVAMKADGTINERKTLSYAKRRLAHAALKNKIGCAFEIVDGGVK